MLSKKFLVLILAVIIACAFSFGAYAASGQGYFGPGTGSDYEVEDDYDDEDEDDDDDYYDDEAEEDEAPVVVPNIEPEPEQEIMKIKADSGYWYKQNFRPESRSTNTKKVIQSYRLDGASERVLLAKHKSAGNSEIGKREQSMRYIRIFLEYPYDYFAAYKAAEMNYGMSRYSTAQKWIDTALEVYPDYSPAERLKVKINGALKRVR